MNEQGKRVGQPETKEPSNEVLARDLGVPEAREYHIQRERTGFEWIGPAESACRETFEITFHNRRDTDEEVHFIERNWLSGKVSNASHPYTQIDTTAMYFLVSVPAKGSVTMTYQLESKW